MKYLITYFFIISSCSNKVTHNNDFNLQIDIYKKDMTYEKFKKAVIEYAEKSTYQNLTNK